MRKRLCNFNASEFDELQLRFKATPNLLPCRFFDETKNIFDST